MSSTLTGQVLARGEKQRLWQTGRVPSEYEGEMWMGVWMGNSLAQRGRRMGDIKEELKKDSSEVQDPNTWPLRFASNHLSTFLIQILYESN